MTYRVKDVLKGPRRISDMSVDKEELFAVLIWHFELSELKSLDLTF